MSRYERHVIVADLAEQGMSTRAIAPVIGKTEGTVWNDLREQVRSDYAPAPPATPTEPTFDPTPGWNPTPSVSPRPAAPAPQPSPGTRPR